MKTLDSFTGEGSPMFVGLSKKIAGRRDLLLDEICFETIEDNIAGDIKEFDLRTSSARLQEIGKNLDERLEMVHQDLTTHRETIITMDFLSKSFSESTKPIISVNDFDIISENQEQFDSKFK